MGLTKSVFRSLIKEHTHLHRRQRTPRRVLKHRTRLLECHTGKPFDEIMHRDVVFEILEQCSNGYTRPTKHPRATAPLPVVFDCSTCRPVDQ
jgi:hypothetical protein